MHTMPHTMLGMKAHHSLTGSINVYSDCHLEKILLLEKLLKSYKSNLFIDFSLLKMENGGQVFYAYSISVNVDEEIGGEASSSGDVIPLLDINAF